MKSNAGSYSSFVPSVNSIIRNKFEWILKQNAHIFCQENALGNVVSANHFVQTWTMKRKCHYFDEIVITGTTGSYHFDKSGATNHENFTKLTTFPYQWTWKLTDNSVEGTIIFTVSRHDLDLHEFSAPAHFDGLVRKYVAVHNGGEALAEVTRLKSLQWRHNGRLESTASRLFT